MKSRTLWLPQTARDPVPSMRVGVFIPVSAVFEDCDPTIAEFKAQLALLSRTDALIWCARLNLVITNSTHHDRLVRQRFAIQQIFAEPQIKKIADFFAEQKNPQEAAVFFRAQLLELMQWIAVFCKDAADDGVTFEDSNVRNAFGKAALIASELWGSRTYTGKLEVDSSLEDIAALRRQSLGATRIGTEAASEGMDPMMAIGRGRRLFTEHFALRNERAAIEFEQQSGVSLESFYGILSLIAIYYMARSPEQGGVTPLSSGLFHRDHLATTTQLKATSARYLLFATQSPDEFAAALRGDPQGTRGLASIRRRPILATSDGRCIVMDPLFFAEHAAVGPLFTLVGHQTSSKARSQCFIDFGYAFEGYARAILRRMYPTPAPPLIDRLSSPFAGQSTAGDEIEIADACLNDATELVLFEMKSSWIPDDAAMESNPEIYVETLLDKFARIEDSSASPKGIGQLVRSISKLATGKWVAKDQDLSRVQLVYPVMVVYDSRLQAAAHTWFLAETFRKALVPDEVYPNLDMRKGSIRISGVIVLSIDDLEALETSIEGFSLIDLLRSYSEASPDRLCCMHTYLASSKFGKRLFANRDLAGSVLEALDTAGAFLGIERIDDSEV
ncbi:MAG: hypothetical protein JWP89_3994 [Schlesneria sp.]|nr:hypothetical protein [Schlesneria sp.]